MQIKRLYRFMLRSFIPLFMMTFFICLFIVLMQFLWRYINDLVGKGLEFKVLAELFFYAALTLVPMALPLAILLSSLMTFGNLGERFELTAMKASGVSLIKVMKPLIAFIVLISIGAFFFQNYAMPVAQTKMYTLLFSMRQKSPELEIPEGVFYDQIPGFNFYVGSKNRETGTLYDLTIYDVSRGFENSRIILADSGFMKMADDKVHLLLQLHDGEQFENLRQSNGGMASQGNQPYRRESFTLKEILLEFNANFNRMDESGMRNQYVGKNIAELQQTIDSVTHRVDSIGNDYAAELLQREYLRLPRYENRHTGARYIENHARPDRVNDDAKVESQPVEMDRPLDLDSLLYATSPQRTSNYFAQAISKAQRARQDYEYRSYMMEDDRVTIRRHGIEMHRKFTLSFACLIFFFIGAPLGAIIRKGGLGTPLVISVLLFIFYYIIDNSGFKMARDGKLAVWQGIWLSSAVLLPLGIFFTYKAMRDSAVFDFDAYRKVYNRLTGKLKRELSVKEFTLNDYSAELAGEVVAAFNEKCIEYAAAYKMKPFYIRWRSKIAGDRQLKELTRLMNETIDYISNSPDAAVVATLNRYPFVLKANKMNEIEDVNRQLLQLLARRVA